MRIGLDFDNTIVSYDALFHKVANEKELISSDMPVNKVSVRDYLRANDQEDAWTEMQGYVYGARLDEAVSYPGVLSFLRQAANAGHHISIISHKTRYQFLGPQYDLHAAARNWIETHLRDEEGCLLQQDNVFLEPTKESKINRIKTLQCDFFLDDLPEILLAENFPISTQRLLFDPEANHRTSSPSELVAIGSWNELFNHIKL